ncbi:MAG: ExbD/TolR family protein [Tepidisphaeraceae bacterium]
MRISGAKKVHYESGPDMTPLVDVVMVILIFLMCVGSFAGAEHYLVSNLPISPTGAGSAETPPGHIPDEPLDIRVDADPRYPDRYVARVGNLQTTETPQLIGGLTAKKTALNAAGSTTEKIQVIISPGRNVKYKNLIDVYQAALQAGFTKVSFATAH